jgi:hypothetical protein
MDSTARRSSIITFNQTLNEAANQWAQQSIIDSRKTSVASNQSDASSPSPKTSSDTTNFVYQPVQPVSYSMVQICFSVEH